jgi:hypothetical protein
VSWDDGPACDEPLGRPFLSGIGRPGPAPGQQFAVPAVPGAPSGRYEHDPAQQIEHHDEVRPYLLTGGRTSAFGAAVAMETIVLATGMRSTRGPDAAGLERARIVRVAERPCSVAEVAARLHLPLQVTLVLVADLVAEGLLDATAVGISQADDVLFLERLIAGVAAL